MFGWKFEELFQLCPVFPCFYNHRTPRSYHSCDRQPPTSTAENRMEESALITNWWNIGPARWYLHIPVYHSKIDGEVVSLDNIWSVGFSRAISTIFQAISCGDPWNLALKHRPYGSMADMNISSRETITYDISSMEASEITVIDRNTPWSMNIIHYHIL